MEFYKKLSPSTRYVIEETARVCACIAAIVVVEMVVIKGVRVVAGVDR